jgi:hypothetical protein
VTQQLLDTVSEARPKIRDSSRRNGRGEGPVISLEPSEPTRRAIRRLRRAVETRVALGHPNLLRARVIGEGDGRLFVAFARCPHRSLSELLVAGPLELAESALLLDGAAAGVDALTQRALVACDLPPDRVMVDPAKGAVLMDLGIPPVLLRQRRPGRHPHVAFRSPEDRAGEPVDIRSSVYSLGALLFTALTGVSPHFPGARERRSELPPDIDAVLARAMAADPAERYPDAKSLSRAVTVAAGLAPASLASEGTPDEAPRRPRRQLRPSPVGRAPAPRRAAPQPTPAANGGRPATGAFGVRVAAALRRCVALVAACLAVAAAAVVAGWSGLSELARSAAHAAVRAGGAADGRARVMLVRPRSLVLPAVAAVVASALSGIALSRAMQPEEQAASSITRSGLTIELPPGWKPARVDAGRGAFSPTIAAAAPGGTEAGFVVGRLGSQAAAERTLERSQIGGPDRAQVRLGAAYAWRYAGLRPRPQLRGVGYLLPIRDGAVVVLCHASGAAAAADLAECGRAATTLVVRGERAQGVPLVDRSAEQLVPVVATLRARRSRGLRRLAAAHLPAGQARAAASLQRSHEEAAQSLGRISDADGTSSLGSLTASLRAASDAYGRLGQAAEAHSRAAYRDARRAVVVAEQAVRRDLGRAGAA